MQESAGTVLNVTADGRLLLAATPDLAVKDTLGRSLEDQRREPAGRIRDVIGPVDAPILIVEAPRSGAPAHRLIGRTLFLSSKRPGAFRPQQGRYPRRNRT
ncbi:MAG: H/ACA ribonucleoprotein complex subunit GAR1/NAF1 [Thermoplasmatota archaeon]